MREETQKKQRANSLLVKLSLATIISVFPSKVHAQSLSCVENLIFGEIITCGGAGTVTVRPDNTNTSSCVTVGSAPLSRARCVVTQSFPFRPIQVNVSSSATINDGGGNSMNVTGFNIITNAGGTGYTQPTGGPFLDVPIGATLNVGATQASGVYTGTFGVTAILQ